MPWFAYFALRQLFPSGRLVSVSALLSIVGVTLGVAVILVVQSVMSGFGHDIRERLLATNGDIRLETGFIIYEWPRLREMALEVEGVASAAPYAQGPVMLQFGDLPRFPVLRGVDLELEPTVLPLDDFFESPNTYGGIDDLHDGGIMMGYIMARQLGVRPGDVVEVYTPLMLNRLDQDEILLPRELEVTGIFDTGYNQIDSGTALVTLRLMQDLYGLDDGVHGLTVNTTGTGEDQLFAVRERLSEATGPNVRAITWLESNQDYLFILSLEKNVIFFIMIFIVVVADFSITNSLQMSVLRKTREIGLLVAMGSRPYQVALAFCLQGFLIGLFGTGLGVALAIGALELRNEVLDVLLALSGREDAFQQFYPLANLPRHYDPAEFARVPIFSIVAATLAGLIPAFRAARLRPAEALRIE